MTAASRRLDHFACFGALFGIDGLSTTSALLALTLPSFGGGT